MEKTQEERDKYAAYQRNRRSHIAAGTWKPAKRGKVAEVHNPLPVAGKTIGDALAGLGE